MIAKLSNKYFPNADNFFQNSKALNISPPPRGWGKCWQAILFPKKPTMFLLQILEINNSRCLDKRSQNLHDGRFLPGANCSAIKLWLAARERIRLHGAPPQKGRF